MKTILVIEDNESNMYLISFILEKHGYGVLQAYNGKEGLKIALEKKPDLIVMDWQLPDIDGIELTKGIKNNKDLKDCPIIFCTSSVMRGDREKALEAGAVAYIEKPIIPEMFIEEIEKVLQ
ncbi:Polar-differentiation response regulator DivK [subsurface metagenome]